MPSFQEDTMTRFRRSLCGFVVLAAPAAALAQVAPDPNSVGPQVITSSEYKLPASVDADVLSGRNTELWARVYRPRTLATGTYPLIVILHGNHATCGRGTNPRIDDRVDYTSTGTCPTGYVVAPNHAGYGYLADKLASWGYIVVSINANRGINAAGGVAGDSGLNLARGRLILKHLQRLSEWNKNGGTPSSIGAELKGRIDFSQVGLIGHSRGGEGIRAAYNQYRDTGSAWPAKILSPVGFRALFEIGPVDGQTSRVLNADGVTWSVLLPMCDGDVSNLQGIKPFDRMMRSSSESPARQKSALAVWGANHNFYNTEWQRSDSTGCQGHTALFPSTIGSPQQRDTAAYTVLALMRGNVGTGADSGYNKLFASRYALPSKLAAITPIERSFQDSASPAIGIVLDDFDRPTGTSTAGAANEASGVTVTHGLVGNRHESGQRGAAISWTSASANTYFQSNFAAAGTGRDVSPYAFLNLRVARQSSPSNPATPNATNFKVQLIDSSGAKSAAVAISNYVRLTGPVGGPAGLHVLLQSAQIPLASFGSFARTRLRGVRLVFDDTKQGAIFVANLRFSNSQVPLAPLVASVLPTADGDDEGSSQAASDQAYEDSAKGTRAQSSTLSLAGDARFSSVRRIRRGSTPSRGEVSDFEIELSSREGFPVRNELPVLRVGGRELSISRYPESGETSRLLFFVDGDTFAGLPDGAELELGYGAHERSAPVGRLNKSLLRD
jgi:hypothetical protein